MHSHARGRGRDVSINLEARRAATLPGYDQSLLCAAPSALTCLQQILIPALTGVAIAWRACDIRKQRKETSTGSIRPTSRLRFHRRFALQFAPTNNGAPHGGDD